MASAHKTPDLEVGQKFLAGNDPAQAAQAFSRVLQRHPDSQAARFGLAQAYARLGKHHAAAELFKILVAEKAGKGKAHLGLANAYLSLGQLSEALEAFVALGRDYPALAPAARVGQADALERLGRVDEAYEVIRAGLSSARPDGEMAYLFARLAMDHSQFRDRREEAVTLLRQEIETRSGPGASRARYQFRLAALYRKMGNYPAAVVTAGKAHVENAGRNSFSIDSLKQNLAELKRNFAGLEASAPRPGSVRQIFILGMPRSGTSLLDKILAVREGGLHLGECNYFHQAVCGLSRDEQVMWGSSPLPDGLVGRVRSAYRQRYLGQSGPASFVSDKSLENVYTVGQILQAFPQARIIWSRRDLRDVCLSCYLQDFAGRHDYCQSLEILANYALEIERLMLFWTRLFPENLLMVDYQTLVREPEDEIRRLIDFLQFDWDPAYLEFYRGKNPVRSLSYNDVTRPLYSDAVGQWQLCRDELAPLLRVLDAAGYDGVATFSPSE